MIMKPENSRWTDRQWQAINECGHDVLVAAAAGSGKTAVLVERIIRKITDRRRRVNIDDLLVVTFTKAAAAEMRERIGRALEKELAEHPEDLFLRRQRTLLSKASIMTLHAFCMSVVKKYYYFLDLDPGFRLLDETEAALLREEVLDDVLEKRYASDDPAFYRLADQYSGDRSDDALRRLIVRLYDFSRSNPWPDQWLDRMVKAYRLGSDVSIDDFEWIGDLKKALNRYVLSGIAALEEARHLCDETGGPAVYAGALDKDIAALRALAAQTGASWETLRFSFLNIVFGKMPACKGRDVDAGLRDQVKKIRDKVKKRIADLQQQWFARSPQESIQDMRDMAPSVALLRALVQDFSALFKKEKRRRGLLDFSDLEHECLAVLRREGSSPDNEQPSLVAEQYRARFEEVLVDEYQDTNRVQESIIQLITKDGGQGGNLFMVGDVKQSIYGFRLAEPGLFTEKYRQFSDPAADGIKIDLSSNFRSRPEVIDGTNFLFRQVMDEATGGTDYDANAELRCGASYPSGERPVDLELIDRADRGENDGTDQDDPDATELEAAAIADRIRAMIGDGSGPAFQVYDRSAGQMRAVRYRDIAILMRSANTSAAVMKDVLGQYGVPSYAELSKGYFDTVEVSVMLSVLQIIDNPYQDIPLASVLRSPIVGLDGDALARIRMADRAGAYYTAVKRYIRENGDSLADTLAGFLKKLSAWKSRSVSRPVSELIWQIYRDTGYYDYVGGLTGGTQRQANLKAFYDRAEQYEKTSFRGLFRFLRFIARMRENGGDLGEARALSEQEDVVRIMTIHKSKGLEFPIVFVAGLNKKFNLKDTAAPALLHKTLGFGSLWIDPDQRQSVPTLLFLAIRERMKADAVAEEMRILYVAVTRAREKLILVSSVPDAKKKVHQWAAALHCRDWLLPEYIRGAVSSFLDWIGPCVIRHQSAEALHELAGGIPDRTAVSRDRSSWTVSMIAGVRMAADQAAERREDRDRLEHLRQWQKVEPHSDKDEEIGRRLGWTYPQRQATIYMAKQTVTEIRSQQEYFSEGQDDRLLADRFREIGGERPHFLQKGDLSPAERGTALHILMQHFDLKRSADEQGIRIQELELVEKEILTPEQADSLDNAAVARFFLSPIGSKMKNADQVIRECPFSLVLDADQVYPSWGPDRKGEEQVLVQGVIDCIIEEEGELTLLDYKTDRLSPRFPEEKLAREELKRRYHVQLDLYRRAIEKIWRRPVARVGLYAFDGGYFVDLSGERGESV
ncbi:helicase-exonuclease AddAB subunit AddA [Sporolactobacillus sp. CQH2019]|uniref:helicase-exonuclease AddAB subunit AddA n=1 Tax=Sporolactobacillus sp. CQH2019 TaxID=3023512 RepID=UPI002367B7B7|nr:helicase-exonuclease AddAB subunit AddA [Sporolactobacillus sp. CQH2019]MDD9147308.1 helicase-exonuclease AddAB subunit AddA [Sporolactobacillus sp. CQH2019]